MWLLNVRKLWFVSSLKLYCQFRTDCIIKSWPHVRLQTTYLVRELVRGGQIRVKRTVEGGGPGARLVRWPSRERDSQTGRPPNCPTTDPRTGSRVSYFSKTHATCAIMIITLPMAWEGLIMKSGPRTFRLGIRFHEQNIVCRNIRIFSFHLNYQVEKMNHAKGSQKGGIPYA